MIIHHLGRGHILKWSLKVASNCERNNMYLKGSVTVKKTGGIIVIAQTCITVNT